MQLLDLLAKIMANPEGKSYGEIRKVESIFGSKSGR